MNLWKDVLPILLLLLLLTACGAEQTKAQDPNQVQSKEAVISTATALTAGGDIGDETPMEWPAELMGDLPPVEGGTITSIDKGSDAFGEGAPDYITVVSLKGFDRKACEAYQAKLEKLGYLDDSTEQVTESTFVYSGSNQQEGTAVSFQYEFGNDAGYVSFNPMYTADIPESWPSDQMGGLPDPGCSLISFTTDGKNDDQVSTVEFAGMSEGEAAEYAASLKELGFKPDTDLSDEETILFRGFDSDGYGVVFNYSVIYENGTISYGKKDAFTGC